MADLSQYTDEQLAAIVSGQSGPSGGGSLSGFSDEELERIAGGGKSWFGRNFPALTSWNNFKDWVDSTTTPEAWSNARKRVFGGVASGVTMGAWEPWKKEIEGTGAAGAGKIVGTVAPWSAAIKAIGIIPKLGTLVGLGGAAARGAAAGIAVGGAEEGVKAIKGEEVSPSTPLMYGALGATGDVVGQIATRIYRGMRAGAMTAARAKMMAEQAARDAESAKSFDAQFANRPVSVTPEPFDYGVRPVNQPANIRPKELKTADDLAIEYGSSEPLGLPSEPVRPQATVESAFPQRQATQKPFEYARREEPLIPQPGETLGVTRGELPKSPGTAEHSFDDMFAPQTARGAVLDPGLKTIDEVNASYMDARGVPRPNTEDIYIGFLGTNPGAFEGLGKSIGELAVKYGGRMVPNFLKQAKNLVVLPESKALIQNIEVGDRVKAYTLGGFIEDMRQLGLLKMSTAEAEALGRQLQDPAYSGAYRQILDNIHATLKEAGLDVGYVQAYLPRQLKEEFAKVFFDDVSGLIAKTGGKDLPETAVVNAIANMHINTRQALNHLVETGQVRGYKEAINLLNERMASEIFPRASFEHARTLDLPAVFYESDARRVLPRYAAQAAKRIAEAKVFGPNESNIIAAIDKLRMSDVNEAAIVERIIQTWTGQYEKLHGFSGAARRWADALYGFQSGTKIGMGFATIPNITQPAISSIMEGGATNFVRGGLKLFNSEYRSQLRRSGATLHHALDAYLGYVPEGWWGKFAQKATKYSGFNFVNKVNLYTSAATADAAVKSWYELAGTGGVRGKWASQRLSDLGLSPMTKPTEEQLAGAIYRFATDSQLQKNILNDPLFMNNPRLRPFVMFKRFGVRQATYTKDVMVRELGRGNVMPLLRLGAGGFAGGEFVIWSKNKIKSMASGEPAYRKEEFASWDRFLNNMAAVGTFGIYSDVFSTPNIERVPSKLEFVTKPVLLSDAERVYDGMTTIMADWKKYGDAWLVTKRNTNRGLNLFGGMVGSLGIRTLTESQSANRMSSKKSKEVSAIYDLILDGKAEQGSRQIALWNENNPSDPMTVEQISVKKILQHAKSKAKTISEAYK